MSDDREIANVLGFHYDKNFNDTGLFQVQRGKSLPVAGPAASTKLLVQGNAGRFEAFPDNFEFAGTNLLGAFTSNATDSLGHFVGGTQFRFSSSTSGIDIGQNSAVNFVIEAPNDTSRFVIPNSDGNVGIRTDSPGNKLTVVMNSATDPIADASQAGNKLSLSNAENARRFFLCPTGRNRGSSPGV
ncbi:MAG: hypothetical protein HY315_10445 [Acidobacteria bacterium]|nr:hypothetical protein [Acidobacteriota bacterium]